MAEGRSDASTCCSISTSARIAPASPPGAEAVALYETDCDESPASRPGGLHVYDGHNHQENVAERRQAVLKLLEPVMELRRTGKEGLAGAARGLRRHADVPGVRQAGFSGPRNVRQAHSSCTTTATAPKYADLAGFTPAALLLTRVISRPTPNRVTFDLGYKAVASDPPAGKRSRCSTWMTYQAVLQNEEHLVIETPHAERFEPGDVAFAIPTHICPTVRCTSGRMWLRTGQVTGTWDIVARDRVLTV